MSPTPLAAFDFDGTCTRRDTTVAFLRFVSDPARAARTAPRWAPVALAHGLGRTSARDAKEALYTLLLAGVDRRAFEDRAARFAAEVIPRFVRPEAVARVAWHRRRGDVCVLVSASLRPALAPWAEGHGFVDTLASELEVDAEDRLTGRLRHHCDGAAKLDALRARFGPKLRVTYAYGDGVGDLCLLAAADHPFYRRMPHDEAP